MVTRSWRPVASHTVAEATLVSDLSSPPRHRALLVVYHGADAGGRTRVIPVRGRSGPPAWPSACIPLPQ